MSHVCGTVETVGPAVHIGPDSALAPTTPDLWQHDFVYLDSQTRFVILHFQNVTLPSTNRLEVDLGYGMDVFTSADGATFWTRPINIHQLPGMTVPIRYIDAGSNSGGAFVDMYGRGRSLPSVDSGHDSITNCDPFIPGPWVEPSFPHIFGSTAPKYDPFWICDKSTPPEWDNARCAGVGTTQRDVSRSAGMIVSIHGPANPYVSTCSVTLIDSDLVALAAHCITDHPFSLPASSVTFDYEVLCDGTTALAYDAVFYKVIRLVKYRYTDGRDYAIIQIQGTPPLPPISVRNGVPAVGEQVFGVHHPNGAVKKISPSGASTVSVLSTGSTVGVNMDVAGGSSGSGLFDLSGRLVGVLSNGGACGISYSSSQLMLNDPIQVPDPPNERAVMLVVDRSGSMSEPALGGGKKIDEARDAADLFISMMRAAMGNEAGLVSFSANASSPIEFPIAPLTVASRGTLSAALPGIVPGGRTSIGDGLAAARLQLDGTSGLPRSILLLTDGMENEPQMIANVGGLSTTEITAIGFGTESNLDGPRLSDLAQSHGGYYKRAGSGLELRKFFALAFGDIFEAGALSDPDLHLSDSTREGPWVSFSVCGEEAVTVVIGWDNAEAQLLLQVRSPAGQILDFGAGGIESASGNGWLFARIPLPQDGERDGTWSARVLRPGGSGEFPPPAVPTDYFLTVIARGGPSLRPFEQPRKLYTGDVLNPRVILQYPDETVPHGGDVWVNVRRPNASVGTVLSQAGLGAPRMFDGDLIPARQATLSQIESQTGAPVTAYINEIHAMTSAGAATGSFGHGGIFGAMLSDALVVEGTYTFHAKAELKHDDCRLTREVQWSHHVSVGIDPDETPVQLTPGDGGGATVTFVPQDRYGNLVGPGNADEMDVTPLPGCRAVGALVDVGDGRYEQKLDCDPDAEHGPGIVVTQPERDPIVLVPPTRKRTSYRYAIQFHCGLPGACHCHCSSLAPGRYATSVSLFNGGETSALVQLSVVPTTLAGAETGHWPDAGHLEARDRTEIGSLETSVVNCCTLAELMLGAPPPGPSPEIMATVLVESEEPLHVTATYTMVSEEGQGASIDVELVTGERRTDQVRSEPPEPPARSAPVTPAPPPRPQDVKRQDPKTYRHEAKSAQPEGPDDAPSKVKAGRKSQRRSR